MQPLGRRDFLKVSALTAGLSLIGPPAIAEVRNGMPYRQFGPGDDKVSILCVGGAHIGRNRSLSEAESIALMRTAVDEGVNFFDNAWEYNDGESERRMGLAMQDGYRDKVFLMTKHHGRDAKVAEQHLNDSLARFKTDMIDLWQFHECIEDNVPELIYTQGALEFALKAKEEGKIRYIGFTGHRKPVILKEMITRGFKWDSVQMPLNCFDPHYLSFTKDVLPLAREKGINVVAMKTLGGSRNALLGTKAVTAAECLRYSMSLPVVTVCSGMDSMDVLRENLAIAKDFKQMSEEEMAALTSRTREYALRGEHENYKARPEEA